MGIEDDLLGLEEDLWSATIQQEVFRGCNETRFNLFGFNSA